MQVFATTATQPGRPLDVALAAIFAGLHEPLWDVSTEHIQLCPQTPTTLTEEVCEHLRESHPNTVFRTHANARAMARLHLLDIARYDTYTRPFFEALADRARRLGSPAVSMHAGYRANATMGQLLDRRARLQELFGDVPVAIEGLYPNTRRPQLVDCWDDYELLLRAQVPMAIDLSHLHIVARAEGTQAHGLVRDLIASPSTYELHVSDNDGSNDQHRVTATPPWWWPLLNDHLGPNALVFTEGNHVGTHRSAGINPSNTHQGVAQ